MNTHHFSWRVFAVLLALGGLALTLSFPLPPPLMPLVAGVAVLAAAIAVGLSLGRRFSLGAPFLERWLGGGADRRSAPWSLSIGAGVGLVLGIAILLWLRSGFVPGASVIHSRLAAEAREPLWSRWIVAFDAAVLEELGFRFFLVSLLVWVLSWKRLPASRWSVSTRVWIAITLVALGFAVAHLPKWFALAAPSIELVASVVVLNGIGGLAFGFLFWRVGIEAAILGHFAADAVLHVLGPWLFLR